MPMLSYISFSPELRIDLVRDKVMVKGPDGVFYECANLCALSQGKPPSPINYVASSDVSNVLEECIDKLKKDVC